MGIFARRLILLLAVLALATGVPVAFAVPPVLVAEPCPHQHQHGLAGAAHHQHNEPRQPQHHDHGAAGCLCCCIGACVAIPDLARAPVAVVPYAALPVVYWDTGLCLTGRSIRPDPAPPRPTLLS
jgi:hypothetical protein